MKFKRILATAFALTLAIPLLIPWAQAHPGRTDGNGGHTDSDTGDYHYHHGYDAHAHFDIDGNGTIDCPYDYDDQTGRNSGTSTGSNSYTPGDGSEDGYQEGYADGYKKGHEESDKAVAEVKEDLAAQEEYTQQLQDQLAHSEGESTLLLLGLLVFFALSAISHVLLCSQDRRHKAELAAAQDNCNKTADRLSREYAAHISTLKSDHAAEIRRLKLRYINFKRLEVLERIAQGKDDSIELPEGVALRPSYTPIRGKTSRNYPYGSYTVFRTGIGSTYHCKHDCIQRARPSHFFDLPSGSIPCRKCVPPDMLPQPLPDWYTKLREKLDTIVSDDDENTSAAGHAHTNDDHQIQFSIDSTHS